MGATKGQQGPPKSAETERRDARPIPHNQAQTPVRANCAETPGQLPKPRALVRFRPGASSALGWNRATPGNTISIGRGSNAAKQLELDAQRS
jgi:hypothetical protein